MACFTPLKGFKDYISGGLTFNNQKGSQPLEVACGQCFGCRVDRALVWTIRITHEAHLYRHQHGNSWVTLTYRDAAACTDEQLKNHQHIPKRHTLTPSHVSKFIRALRKQNQDHKIRYFYCGEYGELGRPHYHLCVFNHSFDDLQLFADEEGLYTYTSPTLEKLWPYGFSTVAPLSYRTAAYTAGYIFEKITGEKARDHYLRCDDYGVAYWLQPEYIRMSTGNKNPPCGLGAGFYEKYKMDFDDDSSPVPGKGIQHKIPRYYESILCDQRPEVLEQIKALRQIYISAHKSDFTPERLRDKYICARANHHLKRKLL